jgi:regulator of protease activity HflC (stomatin/prohibitin superfamily)
MTKRTKIIGVVAAIVVVFLLVNAVSVIVGGSAPGLTHIDPGNIGLVLNIYKVDLESSPMSAGTHFQSPFERVIEIPTMQRTISLTDSDLDQNGNQVQNAVEVNTSSNMLRVDVSCQYHIDPDKAAGLWRSYHEQFENLDNFEYVSLEPAVKEAVNYSIGDMDTTTALTTVGKQKAEEESLLSLNDEWEPRGIVFSNFIIRAVEPDDQSKALLSSTLTETQAIDNAKLGLEQQKIDNATAIQMAEADAKINQLENSTLTDLFVEDQLLSQVHQVYLPSDKLAGIFGTK